MRAINSTSGDSRYPWGASVSACRAMETSGPTSRFWDIDGKMVDLAEVCDALRHGVEIRNRSHMKRLQKNR